MSELKKLYEELYNLLDRIYSSLDELSKKSSGNFLVHLFPSTITRRRVIVSIPTYHFYFHIPIIKYHKF